MTKNLKGREEEKNTLTNFLNKNKGKLSFNCKTFSNNI